MNINGITGAARANQYTTNSEARTSLAFGRQLSETAKQRMQTASAYETGIHTGPLETGTETPASREGVAVDTTQYADGLLTVSRMAAPNVAPASAPAPVQDAAENNKTYYVEGGPTITEIANKHIASAPPGSIQIFIPKENTVCSEGRGENQYVYAEYTADSTLEDPIVRIYCRSNSGTYEFTRHINDIDPANCTYAELAALYGHQIKSGAREPVGLIRSPVPMGYEVGDIMQRQNFLTGLDALSRSKMFGPGILQDAEAFLEFYSVLAEERKAMEAEAAEFERLMRVVDNFIEDIKEDAKVRAEKAEKEKIDQLFETEQEEDDRALKRSDHEKILEDLL